MDPGHEGDGFADKFILTLQSLKTHHHRGDRHRDDHRHITVPTESHLSSASSLAVSGHSAVHSLDSNHSAQTAGGPLEDEDVGPESFVVGDPENSKQHETAGREPMVNEVGLIPAHKAFVDAVADDDVMMGIDDDVMAMNEYTIGAASFASPQEEGFLNGGRFGRNKLRLKNGENSHGFNGTLY